MTSQTEKDKKAYYKRFDLKNVKDKKNIENELIYQLYKKPKERVKPHFASVERGDTHQYDILFK